MSGMQEHRDIDDMKMWLIKRWNVKQKQDEKTLYIRSCSILPNKQIVLADESNQRLMIYNKEGGFICEIKVSGPPFDIEAIGYSKIAVSYGIRKYIEFINVEQRAVERRIRLNGICSGMTFDGESLFVLVYGVGIQKIGVKTQDVTTMASTICAAFALTMSPDRIFYVDLHSNSLCCCDFTGRLCWRKTSSLFEGSQTISADNFGNVFVAATQANKCIAVSLDGEKLRKLLDDKQGVYFPSAIHYSKQDKCLLVCSRESGQVCLYNLM